MNPFGYVAVFLGSLSLALLLTPVANRVAHRFGVLDHPGEGHKAHERPTPYLGGTAILAAFAVVVMAGALVLPANNRDLELGVILGCALALSVIGLIDDIRGLGPFIRLAAEVAAAVAVFSVGARVQLFGEPVLDGLITVVWVVGVINATNWLDNMDGLSAGVAAIASAFFAVIAAIEGQFLVATLAAALAGCTLGFLRHNFHPARIYMGDAGSMFIGFLLAVIGIKLRFNDLSRDVAFFVPVLVLGVPIFDATLATTARLLHRRSPLIGGLDHTSHRLVAIGIPVRVAVSLIYGAALACGWLGIVMARVDRVTGFVLMGFVLAAGAFFGTLLGLVPVYESSKRPAVELRRVERPTHPPRTTSVSV